MQEEKSSSLPLAGQLARQLLAGWLAGSLVPTMPEVAGAYPMLCEIVNRGDYPRALRGIIDLIDADGLTVDPAADPEVLVAIRRARMVVSA